MSRVLLETRRLVLREFSDHDLEPLAAILGDPETMRFYPRPFTLEESRRWIERNRASYTALGFGLWALEERGTGTFLGDCGLAVRIVEGRPEIEMGWHVVRTRWGEGIATEAAVGVRDHARASLGLGRLVSLVVPENVPSCRVAEKAGMHVEREVTYKGLHHLLYSVEEGIRASGSPR